ncbi:MAG: hypothetical protein JXQ30_15950 [Spirochaetes bacterium]|nr:hypothetical protein [Spirochaetota bacterium]
MKRCNLFLLLVFVMALGLSSGVAVLAQEVEGFLEPHIDVESYEFDPLADYFGLELKWYVEQNMASGVIAKITYMDPEVYFALIGFEASMQGKSEGEIEEEVEKARSVLKEYLVFKVFSRHDDDPEKTAIGNWKITLLIDDKTKYEPDKIEEGEAELRKAHAGPYFGRETFVYFKRTKSSGKKAVLNEDTRSIKLLLSNDAETVEFLWAFCEEAMEVERCPTAFHPYLRIGLVIILGCLIILLLVTRPGRARRDIWG